MSADYRKMDQKDMDFLRSVCSPERVTAQGGQSARITGMTSSAESKGSPKRLIKVLSTREVSEIMKYAHEHKIPVTPRGQGTGLVGASVALHGGIMLDFCAMNHFLELDEVNMTLTLEPGVLLMEIAKFVEPHNLFYPPDPGEKTATIGGNVNTNAAECVP